jgi:hypothetical protein
LLASLVKGYESKYGLTRILLAPTLRIRRATAPKAINTPQFKEMTKL